MAKATAASAPVLAPLDCPLNLPSATNSSANPAIASGAFTIFAYSEAGALAPHPAGQGMQMQSGSGRPGKTEIDGPAFRYDGGIAEHREQHRRQRPSSITVTGFSAPAISRTCVIVLHPPGPGSPFHAAISPPAQKWPPSPVSTRACTASYNNPVVRRSGCAAPHR